MKEKLNQFKAEFAEEIFKKADEGAISKEVALDLLTVYDLLPIAPWIELPTFMDSYDYFPRLRDYIFSKTNLWLKPTNEK